MSLTLINQNLWRCTSNYKANIQVTGRDKAWLCILCNPRACPLHRLPATQCCKIIFMNKTKFGGRYSAVWYAADYAIYNMHTSLRLKLHNICNYTECEMHTLYMHEWTRACLTVAGSAFENILGLQLRLESSDSRRDLFSFCWQCVWREA